MRAPLSHTLLTAATTAALALTVAPAAAHAQSPEDRAAQLVAKMTTDEKLDFVASGVKGVSRLGIPPLVLRDGPSGVGEGEAGVTSFPTSVTLGSTWDPALARRVGAALGTELRGKGGTVLLAPTIEPLRNPLWGRAPETYGEDPVLNARLATDTVRGIQSAKVLAQIKHFTANTQEFGRFGLPLGAPGVSSQVAERTLQEIYFPPFKAAIKDGKAGSVMCSYNRVNGTPVCQTPKLINTVKSWGLRGFVGIDAVFAVRDVAAAAAAGVDNFQLQTFPPGGERAALASVPQARVDDAARHILVGMAQTGLLEAGVSPKQPTVSTAAHRALASRVAAEGTVLLKNARHVLPLERSDRSIAVIGSDAGKGTQTQEGGSPAVGGGTPITPLDAIRRQAPAGTKVAYAAGTRGVVPLPGVPASVLTPASGSGHGLSGDFFADRAPTFTGTPTATRVDPTIDFDTSTDATTTQVFETIPDTNGASSGRWTGTLTPPKTGQYRFSLTFSGNAKLYLDGKRLIAGDTEFVQGKNAGYPGAPDVSYHGTVDLTAGKAVPIRVEYATNASIGGAVLKLGWQPPEPWLRQAAVDAARKADKAIVFVNDVSAEGMDRTSLSLPGDQDDLVRAVAKANPNTVVVLHTAGAVAMPWKNQVAGIVEAWYPGQQSGAAIADVLFGRVDPSGRLPLSFPAAGTKNPAITVPSDTTGADNTRTFGEGLKVGYRWYDAAKEKPLFPFGFGLSYTTFRMSGLRVRKAGSGATVSVRVKNTGTRTGSQTVQVYVGFPAAAGEPPRQLKAFRKVTLKAGRSSVVRLSLGADSFQVFDADKHARTTAKGRFRVFAGSSSRDLPLAASLVLEPAPGGGADPSLRTAPATLAAALHCTGNLRTGGEPVLLVHGTSATGREAFVAPVDFAAAVRATGSATCYVDLPEFSLGDIQTSAEYVVAAIRSVSRRAGRPIAVYAHSQGGLLTRWALTYWPSLRRQVADAVTASGSHHGTNGGRLAATLDALCGSRRGCPPAFLQQRLDSRLLAALNDGKDETPGPTAWTTIRTTGDDIVQPVSGAALKGATNVLIQAVCPGRVANHDDARFDSVSFAALVDALRHPGPAKVSRLPKDVCATPYAPGLKADAVKAAKAQASDDSVSRTLGYAHNVTEEPPLRAYAG